MGEPSVYAAKKWDGDGVPLEDSNCAGIGTEEDKELRRKAAATEPAWAGVGTEPGLWIWRIEKFKVVPWPKEKYGKFCEGDSYICLHAQEITDREGNKKLELDIHFWLGKTTSTDEKGTAAYKTVELDDLLGGEPCQHREVQGNESHEFTEIFPGGIEYLAGGVDSGFNVTQQDIFVKKLYQCRKNEKKKIVFEQEQVALSSLNHRDCFMLDAGRKIYVWFGDSASPFLRNATNTKAENLEQERKGESQVVTEVDDEFWAALGGKGDITAADAVGAEVEADFGEGVLYSVNVNEARELDMKEVGRGELSPSMLDPTAVMLLDAKGELFVWLGKEASEIEKRIAMKTASNYLKMNGKDVDKTPISIIKQGHEKNKTWISTFAS